MKAFLFDRHIKRKEFSHDRGTRTIVQILHHLLITVLGRHLIQEVLDFAFIGARKAFVDICNYDVSQIAINLQN